MSATRSFRLRSTSHSWRAAVRAETLPRCGERVGQDSYILWNIMHVTEVWTAYFAAKNILYEDGILKLYSYL